jgi:cell division protein FtsX
MQIVNAVERTLTLQQRRHDELTNALAKTAQQRDDVIAKLCRLDAKLTDLKRKVGRSGKRLADTRAALTEKPPVVIEPPKAKRVIKVALKPEGDGLADVVPVIDPAVKAAKLREEIARERGRRK